MSADTCRKCPHCGSDKIIIRHYRLAGMPPATFGCEDCKCVGQWDEPKGPAGGRGQVGWMGGEYDR